MKLLRDKTLSAVEFPLMHAAYRWRPAGSPYSLGLATQSCMICQTS